MPGTIEFHFFRFEKFAAGDFMIYVVGREHFLECFTLTEMMRTL